MLVDTCTYRIRVCISVAVARSVRGRCVRPLHGVFRSLAQSLPVGRGAVDTFEYVLISSFSPLFVQLTPARARAYPIARPDRESVAVHSGARPQGSPPMLKSASLSGPRLKSA